MSPMSEEERAEITARAMADKARSLEEGARRQAAGEPPPVIRSTKWRFRPGADIFYRPTETAPTRRRGRPAAHCRRAGGARVTTASDGEGLWVAAEASLTPQQRAARDERLARQADDACWLADAGREADASRAAELARWSPPSAEVVQRVRDRVAAQPLEGCAECRALAYTGRHEPYLVDSVVMQTRVWRCSACGMAWEETSREVHALTDAEVVELYGALLAE